MPDNGGTVGASTGDATHVPSALEVLAGIDKFVTANSYSGIGLLARPDLPDGIAVDKRVLSIPASSRLDATKAYTTYRFIEWAIIHTTDMDDHIVARAKKLMR